MERGCQVGRWQFGHKAPILGQTGNGRPMHGGALSLQEVELALSFFRDRRRTVTCASGGNSKPFFTLKLKKDKALFWLDSWIVRPFFGRFLLFLSFSMVTLSATTQSELAHPLASARLFAQSSHSTSRRSSAASSTVERAFVDCYLFTDSYSGWYLIDLCARPTSESP